MKKIIAGIAIAGGLTLASAGAASASAASAPGHTDPNPNKEENCLNAILGQDARGQTGNNTGSAKDPKQVELFDTAVANCDGFWFVLDAIGSD